MSKFLASDPKYQPFLSRLGIQDKNPGVLHTKWTGNGPALTSVCPANNRPIAEVTSASIADYQEAVSVSQDSWKQWCQIPAPKRGEIVRQIGEELRNHLEDLGKLVSLEMGKILSEGIGEVQEFIDIIDYSVGLSRMINGKIIPSEREDHTLLEMWNPLGMSIDCS